MEFLNNLFPIDYEGQILSEKIFYYFLPISAVISFIAGFITKKMSVTLITYLILSAICALIVLPPFPFYRRQNLKFLQSTKKEDQAEEKENKPKAE